MIYSYIMKCLRAFALFLFGIVLGVSWFPATTSAASLSIKNETVLANSVVSEEKLFEATVNLYCRIKVGNKEVSSTGSGVMIDSRGVILTNAHVAQYFLLNGEDSKLTADCSVRTGSPAKEAYEAEVLYISKNWLDKNIDKSAKELSRGTGENDFALLYITSTKRGKLPAQFQAYYPGVTMQLDRDKEVVVAGYPAGDLNFKGVRNKLKALTATTTITSLQTFESGTADLISLSPSKIASSGVSGGPVVMSGVVTGIVATMGTSKKKEGASLRAITLPYINRVIQSESGLSLASLYTVDLAARAKQTEASISTEILSFVEKQIRVSR